MRVILTTCPDCGASPAETHCECDFVGIRAQRRIDEVEAYQQARCRAYDQRIAELEAALNAAREDSARLDKACEEMMIGGNHLASALIGWLGAEETKFPPYTADFETAQNVISDPRIYDAWVAWRAIMRFRDAIEVARKERT